MSIEVTTQRPTGVDQDERLGHRVGAADPDPDPGPAAVEAAPTWRRLLPRVAIGVVLGVLVLSALALFADVQELGDALRGFEWWLAGPVLLLTCFNYGLRFVKWEIYLRRLKLPRPPLFASLLVYLSAFSMSITPGKVGEVIKAVLLRRLTGAPVAKTTAIIAAERLTDGLAMLALAGVGLLEFGYGRALLGMAALMALLAAFALQRPGFAVWATAKGRRLPVVGGAVGQAGGFFDASNVLFRPGLLAGMTLLGVVSWAGECLAFYIVLIGLDLDPSWRLVLVATFVLAVSSVFGAISLLPGGLVVAEAGVTGLLLLLLPSDEISRGGAVAATLLIRFATLWFAVFLGFGAIGLLYPRLGKSRRDASTAVHGAGRSIEPGV